MIKFIFSFKKNPTGEGNYNYPVGLDTMPAVTVGVDDKIFSKQHFVSKPIGSQTQLSSSYKKKK